jgi:hypothetical protein
MIANRNLAIETATQRTVWYHTEWVKKRDRLFVGSFGQQLPSGITVFLWEPLSEALP